MDFHFPKYPFLWNYYDMYNPIEFTNKIIEKKLYDDNINDLINLFADFLVVEQEQRISKVDAKNINIHTWYLSINKLCSFDDNNIIISSDSKIKCKKEVFAFIYDPYNIFDKSIYKYDKKSKANITIIKNNIKTTNLNLIPKFYIHAHNIKGIFRFSPDDNSQIKFNDTIIIEPVFYTVVDKLIVKNILIFI
jgi:hypothetical protein